MLEDMAAMRVSIVAAALLMLAPSMASPATEKVAGADAAKIAETVRALDVNGNGKVDQNEILEFAKSQGLSKDEVFADFKELDANGDGALDATEIGPLFAAAAEEEATTKPVLTSTAVAAEPTKAAAASPTSLSSSPSSITTAAAPIPAAATSTAGTPEVGIDLIALQRDAARQASNVVAAELAQRAQALIDRSAQDDKSAAKFEAQAQAFRSQAAELAKKVAQEVRLSASAASKSASEKAAPELNKMKDDESKADLAAKAHQEEAKRAMERVHEAQSFLRSS